MHNYLKISLRWFLLTLLISGLGCFFYFHLYEFLTLSSLKKYHEILLSYADQHYTLAVICYIAMYTLAVAFSLPATIIIALTGGYLFGPIAAIYVILSMTIGSAIVFVAVRTTLATWLMSKANKWLLKMEAGFEKNAFNYLVAMRLIPIFPAWAINIAAALSTVRLRTFLIATFLGIIPSALIYAIIGNGLNNVLKSDQLSLFSLFS